MHHLEIDPNTLKAGDIVCYSDGDKDWVSIVLVLDTGKWYQIPYLVDEVEIYCPSGYIPASQLKTYEEITSHQVVSQLRCLLGNIPVIHLGDYNKWFGEFQGDDDMEFVPFFIPTDILMSWPEVRDQFRAERKAENEKQEILRKRIEEKAALCQRLFEMGLLDNNRAGDDTDTVTLNLDELENIFEALH